MFKILRFYLTFILLSAGIGLPAVAATDSIDSSLNQDLALAFSGSNTVLDNDHLSLLSDQEMKETEGRALWFAPVLWNGTRYALTGITRHGLSHIMSGRVSNRAILHTLRSPRYGSYSSIIGRNAGTTRYIGKYSTVVLNRQGRLVTAWKTKSMR